MTFDDFCVKAQRVDLAVDDYDLGKAVKQFDLCVGEEGHGKSETRAALEEVMAELDGLYAALSTAQARARRLFEDLEASKEAP